MSGFQCESGVKMSNFSDILMFDIGTVLGKLFIAAILGGFIGWERERRGRPAGLRTHIPCMCRRYPDDASFRTYFCQLSRLQK